MFLDVVTHDSWLYPLGTVSQFNLLFSLSTIWNNHKLVDKTEQ